MLNYTNTISKYFHVLIYYYHKSRKRFTCFRAKCIIKMLINAVYWHGLIHTAVTANYTIFFKEEQG